MQNRNYLKRLISLLMSLVMSFSLFTGLDITVNAATSDDYELYLADYLCQNQNAQDYINGENYLPYRVFVEGRRYDPTYISLVAAWQVATFSLKSPTEYSTKVVGYYETILFDIICGEQNSASALEDLDNLVDSCEASSLKKVYSMYGELSKIPLKDMDKNSTEYKNMMKTISGLNFMKDAFDCINNFGDVLGYCNDIYDYLSKCSKLQAVAQKMNGIDTILMKISSKTSDPALAKACDNVAKLCSESLDSAMVKSIFIGEKTATIVTQELIGDLWNDIVAQCTGYGLAIKAGQAMGKLSANLLFSTEADIEHHFSMCALYDFEDMLIEIVKSYQSAYLSNRTVANAKIFNESFKLLLKTYLEGVEYSDKYAQINYDQGLINNLIKHFNQEEYDDYKYYLGLYKGNIEKFFSYITVEMYNGFFAMFESDDDQELVAYIKSLSGVSAKTQNVSDEEYQDAVELFGYVSERYYGLDLTKSKVLTSNVETFADVVMTADLDLNGYTLTINGDLLQSGGTMKIGTGILNVKGDYRIAKKYVDEYGDVSYDMTSAYLNMNNAVGVLNVDGDFSTYSSEFFNNSTPKNVLTAGTMQIGGNFYQYSSDSDTRYCAGFPSKENHIVTFKGDKIHEVYFDEASYSSISKLTNIKTIDNAKIKFTGRLTGFTMCQDLTIEGYTTLTDGTMNLNGYTLTINGDLLQSGGTMKIETGTLNVKGDYQIASKTVDDLGEVTYNETYARLHMYNEADTVNIDGDFITKSSCGTSSSNTDDNVLKAGTMNIGGDFYQYSLSSSTSSERNFAPSGTHKVVLMNKGSKVHFDSPSYNYFNILELKHQKKYYTFSNDNCWNELILPVCDHNLVLVDTVPPTDDGEGKNTYFCDECNNTIVEVIPATGHTTVVDKAVAPTCTETGLTEGSHCSTCNEVLVAQQVVDALGHNVVLDPAVAPTVTEFGLTEGYHCSNCGLVFSEQELIRPLGYTVYLDSEKIFAGYDDTLVYEVEETGVTYQWYATNNADGTRAVAVKGATDGEFSPMDYYGGKEAKYKYFYCVANFEVDGVKLQTTSPMCINAFAFVGETDYSYIDYENAVIYTDSLNNSTYTDILTLESADGLTATVSPSYQYGEAKGYGTGSTLTLAGDGGTTVFTVVVYGDINGDGAVDVLDGTAIARAATGNTDIDGVYGTAADIDGSGDINPADYQSAINKILAA